MQINPIATASTNQAGDTDPAASSGKKTLNVDDFLKLLSVQMQAQDPLNPMQDTEFIAQMSSFTSLEQMKNLSNAFTTFTAGQRVADAQSYIGKKVTVQDPAQGEVAGIVGGVEIVDGEPSVKVGTSTYSLNQITAIYPSGT